MRLRLDRTGIREVGSAAEFGRVAVLYGGSSAERDISLLTGAAVHEALQRRGVTRTRYAHKHFKDNLQEF